MVPVRRPLRGRRQVDEARRGTGGREESGIHELVALPQIVMLDRHELGTAFGSCREHLDVRYAAIAPQGAAHSASDESFDVRWWPADRLPEDTSVELAPLVRAAQALIRR